MHSHQIITLYDCNLDPDHPVFMYIVYGYMGYAMHNRQNGDTFLHQFIYISFTFSYCIKVLSYDRRQCIKF